MATPTLLLMITLPETLFRSAPNQAPFQPWTMRFPEIVLSLIGKFTYGLNVAPGPPPFETTFPWIVSPSRYIVHGWLATMFPPTVSAVVVSPQGGGNGGPSEPG